jgi:hypothetical protein
MKTRFWSATLPSGARVYIDRPHAGSDGVRTYVVVMERRGSRPDRVCAMVTPGLEPAWEGGRRGIPGMEAAVAAARRACSVDEVMAA